MRFFVLLAALFLTACGADEVVQKRPEVSYQDVEPAAGMSYGDFRKHEAGSDDMLAAQKRFMILDRDNNGRLTPDEFQ